jgi:hypothetical protein
MSITLGRRRWSITDIHTHSHIRRWLFRWFCKDLRRSAGNSCNLSGSFWIPSSYSFLSMLWHVQNQYKTSRWLSFTYNQGPQAPPSALLHQVWCNEGKYRACWKHCKSTTFQQRNLEGREKEFLKRLRQSLVCRTLGSHSGGYKTSISWDITSCTLLKVNRRFGRTCCLHFQVRRISQEEFSIKPCGKQMRYIPEGRALTVRCMGEYYAGHCLLSSVHFVNTRFRKQVIKCNLENCGVKMWCW